MLIRCAKDADFPRIKEIFAVPGDRSSSRQWTLASPRDEALERARSSTHFVVQENDRLVGYAGYRCGPGNDAVVEHEIVLGAGADDENSAHTLLAALVEHARVRGFRMMIATIGPGNARSIAIHEKLGFVHANLVVARAVGTAGGDRPVAMTLDLRAEDEVGLQHRAM